MFAKRKTITDLKQDLMTRYRIHPDTQKVLSDFAVPKQLGFGEVKVPLMYRADYLDGEWVSAELQPYGPIELDPAAKVLHYAQEVFEGMKAYRVDGAKSETPHFFRPLENLARMNRSADRMCMISVPESIFMDGIGSITAHAEPFIPRNSGESLYLRPFLIGTRPNLGMGISNSFIFIVIASPSAIYHSGNMRVQIERSGCRAARGGTGAAKTGGNYAAALQSAKQVQQRGYDQSLWLDPINMENIEELSGMNFFVELDGALHTPMLNGSFLAGVTRDSIVQLARHKGMEVVERDLPISEILEAIESGRATEAFACGTAAIVAPISLIADADGKEYVLPSVDVVAATLRTELLAVQEGRSDDPFGWVTPLDAGYYPSIPN